MSPRTEAKSLDLFEGKPDSNKQDRISFLPDELLVHILSHMRLRQAVSTGVLSKRWFNLWTRIPSLNFDAPNMFDRELDSVTQRLSTSKFVSRVDSVLNQMMHRSLSILSFSVFFEMAGEDMSHIDRWISFVVDRDIETLNLFLHKKDTINWSFPPRLVSTDKPSCQRELRLGGVKIGRNFVGFKNLKLISLTSVLVQDEAFDDMMSNCVHLVDLYVRAAENLKFVKIPESSARLRFLNIHLCPGLLELEVNAANLVIFSYVGDRVEFSFNNITKLLLVRLGALDEGFPQLLSQNLLLQTLSLDLGIYQKNLDVDFSVLPTLTNLKVLTLSIAHLSNGFDGLIILLRATPALIKFVVRLKDPGFSTPQCSKVLPENFRHKSLRQIELCGFSGGEEHVKLACFLMNISVALEKFTILSYHISYYLDQRLCLEPDREQLETVRNSIDRISRELPPTTKLEFIER